MFVAEGKGEHAHNEMEPVLVNTMGNWDSVPWEPLADEEMAPNSYLKCED